MLAVEVTLLVLNIDLLLTGSGVESHIHDFPERTACAPETNGQIIKELRLSGATGKE